MACMHGGVSRRHAVGAAIAVAGVATLAPSPAFASVPQAEGAQQSPGYAVDTTAATSFDHSPHHPNRLQPPHSSGHKRRGGKAAGRVARASLPCGLGVSKVCPSLRSEVPPGTSNQQ